ncbi:PP2C family serine/threonine-protein phosphatase [Polymorphospora sp. NPDC051019]|uniref:PP2C family protein-serine/threonine phosphatase n=1 Tax=Polymorphospora sp. NPDC051019 TaxID=3155725 RepID=UPI0034392C8F
MARLGAIEEIKIRRTELTVAGRRLAMTAGTVVGNRYPANFDVLHLDDARPLVVVADGMGAGEGSRVAGRTTVDVFVGMAAPGPGPLRAAVAEAQRRLREAGHRLGELTGCTLTAFVGDDHDAWLVQIGDSRAYRLRDGQLELLTVDHTAAWLGAVNGWYPFDSPRAHADRYRLMRYVGHPDQPEPDVLNVTLRPGDVYLLCTDGLAEQVPYGRIAEVLTRDGNPVGTLLAESLRAGGNDNATGAVIAIH